MSSRVSWTTLMSRTTAACRARARWMRVLLVSEVRPSRSSSPTAMILTGTVAFITATPAVAR